MSQKNSTGMFVPSCKRKELKQFLCLSRYAKKVNMDVQIVLLSEYVEEENTKTTLLVMGFQNNKIEKWSSKTNGNGLVGSFRNSVGRQLRINRIIFG